MPSRGRWRARKRQGLKAADDCAHAGDVVGQALKYTTVFGDLQASDKLKKANSRQPLVARGDCTRLNKGLCQHGNCTMPLVFACNVVVVHTAYLAVLG